MKLQVGREYPLHPLPDHSDCPVCEGSGVLYVPVWGASEGGGWLKLPCGGLAALVGPP